MWVRVGVVRCLGGRRDVARAAGRGEARRRVKAVKKVRDVVRDVTALDSNRGSTALYLLLFPILRTIAAVA